MVEGIIILNKIAVTGLPPWLMISAIILFTIGLLVFFVFVITDGPAWTAIISLVSLLVFMICGILDATIKTDGYRYECIIDDSVSYNEIVENYNIIERRGDIWVLEDK